MRFWRRKSAKATEDLSQLTDTELWKVVKRFKDRMDAEEDGIVSESIRFLVFHIADRASRDKILKYGLLPRAELKRRRIRFHEKADESLRPRLSGETKFNVLDGNRLTTQSIELGTTVPCHFVKPLNRPEVGPTDAFKWEKEGVRMDAWVVKRKFLERTPHRVCVGHWAAPYFGGPILLSSINQFVTFLEDPATISNARRLSHYFPKFFEDALPNILRGRVKTEYLTPTNRYRHLLNSSIFVLSHVPSDALEVVEYARLADLSDDPRYAYEVDLP